jgi:transposase-like protein
MNDKTNQLLDSLIKEIKTPEEFNKLRDQLFKRGVQTLLSAEMDAHLGYAKGEVPTDDNIRNGYSEKTLSTQNGEVTIKVPRDRKASFEPIIVPKHRTMVQEIEDMILLLYAKGMSTADIVDFIEQTYGVQYSAMKVSLITNGLLEDIKNWQQRPLESLYAVIWIDAIHYKIRHEGKVISKAAMLVLGIDIEGHQDILAIHIVTHESAASWTTIFNDLKLRGVQDILFLCSDNLTGIQQAVESCFPQSTHQICIVHQIRNSMKHVSFKDRKAVIADLKSIYQADNLQQADSALEHFKSIWGDKYSQAVKSWTNNWDALTTFLDYPPEIRKIIYTTNIIESFNASLRKFTRNKKVFPNDEAALKSIYLAAQQIKPKWNKTRYNWPIIYNQLYIYFENRIK